MSFGMILSNENSFIGLKMTFDAIIQIQKCKCFYRIGSRSQQKNKGILKNTFLSSTETNLVKKIIFFVIQQAPLNVITLVPILSDNISRMITVAAELLSYSLTMILRMCKHGLRLQVTMTVFRTNLKFNQCTVVGKLDLS